MQSEPKVSVLMPVYNAASCIGDALQSILRQTLREFEAIIIDDGSSDNTLDVIRNFNDPRIRLLKLSRNVGPINAANIGLAEVNAPYIIRMDADDISMPERFEKQYQFMEQHQDTGVCGTGVKITGQSSKEITKPEHNNEIVACMLFSNPVALSSAIIRSSLMREKGFRYRDKFPHMAEYDLWYRLKSVTRFANLKNILVHTCNSDKKTTETEEHTRQVRSSFFLDKLIALGIKPNTEELDIHLDLTDPIEITTDEHPAAYKVWLEKLHTVNQITYAFPRAEFEKVIDKKWQALEQFFRKDGHKLIEYEKLSGKTNFQALTDAARQKLKQIFNL
jgi:glycosyltransferase involved in cell wall biosynthesis